MKVTNRSPGLQGVHTLNGVVFLKPGETRDNLALTEDHARRADRLPFIAVEGQPHPTPSPTGPIEVSPRDMDVLRGRFEGMTAEIADLGERLRTSVAANEALARELDVARAEVASLKGQVAKTEDKGGGVDGTPALPNVAQVLAMAEDKDVPFMTFKSAASKLLGDATPAKKDEIVAALEELATKP